MMIHVLFAFLAATFGLVYSVPHCPGGQLAPKVTVTTTRTTTATTTVTTTIHHTLTVTHHIPSSVFSFSTKHKFNQPTVSSFAVTIPLPAPTAPQTNLPPPKGGSPLSFSSLSNSPGPKSTSISDCDIPVDNGNGRLNGSVDGSGNGPGIQNESGVSGGSSYHNSSFSKPTRHNDGSPAFSNGNNSIHGPVENPSGSNDENVYNSDKNSNDSNKLNKDNYGIGSSEGISHPPMKLCCNSQGQADSLVITLMAHILGLDLSNKTGIIGVGCTVIGEGSLRDAPECPHSLIECGSFSFLDGVGSDCSI